MIKTALVSLSDKKDTEKILKILAERKVNIIATSGTAKFIKDNGLPVTETDSVTGQKEILGGRVKTLHPSLFAGILARRDNPKDMEQLKDAGFSPIDLVIVNFYPYTEKGLKSDTTDEAVEFIDIGGPSLVRSAAKNHRWVTVLTSNSQYKDFLDQIKKNNGDTTLGFRKKCAAKAFRLTSNYDAVVAASLEEEPYEGESSFPFILSTPLTYGENPHQNAFFLKNPLCEVSFSELSKGMSYNNILDAESALRAVKLFDRPAVAVVKHQSICGLAEDSDIIKAYKNAYDTDPDSAFGGIFAINRKIDPELAEIIDKTPFLTMIIAPSAEENASKILSKKKKRLIVLSETLFSLKNDVSIRSVTGGFLVQTNDIFEDVSQWETVTSKKPSDETLRSLVFAQKAVMSVKSNAIVLADSTKTIGIGGGNVSRIDSVAMACLKAGEKSKGSVMASDAFFPFPDSIEYASEKGICAVVQPGGSKMDDKVLECAEKCGMIMIHSKRRHFYH
ncbi:bifunctional phosphoribosylaminoimidazolecarboxamide formyltransferase/IMP cyclohydrolase [candidate division WOR-3 bacterium]|nr:bifunctional phosphoribosylaminoimidazolecarboxamide formyltransferase/IMP cyclohydrolase [candidate division WOR-3 bacterium]